MDSTIFPSELIIWSSFFVDVLQAVNKIKTKNNCENFIMLFIFVMELLLVIQIIVYFDSINFNS